jgi:hypothetical protein
VEVEKTVAGADRGKNERWSQAVLSNKGINARTQQKLAAIYAHTRSLEASGSK